MFLNNGNKANAHEAAHLLWATFLILLAAPALCVLFISTTLVQSNVLSSKINKDNCEAGLNCKLPDCFCRGTQIPKGLKAKDIPQMIMITFDDAVNVQVFKFVEAIINVIYQTWETVFHHISKQRRELKIRRAAEYFWRNSRCLEMWWNTVSSVWYIFSIETKTKE